MSTPPNLNINNVDNSDYEDYDDNVLLPVDDVGLTNHLIKPVLDGGVLPPPLLGAAVADAVHRDLVTLVPQLLDHRVVGVLQITVVKCIKYRLNVFHVTPPDERHRRCHEWGSHWGSCMCRGRVCLGTVPSSHHSLRRQK